jgi:hypothetical protein
VLDLLDPVEAYLRISIAALGEAVTPYERSVKLNTKGRIFKPKGEEARRAPTAGKAHADPLGSLPEKNPITSKQQKGPLTHCHALNSKRSQPLLTNLGPWSEYSLLRYEC